MSLNYVSNNPLCKISLVEKKDFRDFVRMQMLGTYNMNDSRSVMTAMGWDPNDESLTNKYFEICFGYKKYAKKWPTVRKEVAKELYAHTHPIPQPKPQPKVELEIKPNDIPNTIYLIYIRKPNSNDPKLRNWRAGSSLIESYDLAKRTLSSMIDGDTMCGCRNERKEYRLVQYNMDVKVSTFCAIEKKKIVEQNINE